MPLRYRLLAFSQSSILTPQDCKTALESFGGFQDTPIANLCTAQWTSVLKHALAAGAKSILLQEGVRDPDFLEEYEAFYSRQQQPINRLCRRLHFFSITPAAIEQTDPSAVLDFIDLAAATVPNCYLGFVTLRPLRHAPVGASILVALPNAQTTCKDTFPVHIAGRQFEVVGTPYLQQDNAVGACAQASIWVALRTLRRRSGNSAFSPAELTVAATKHLAFNRVFPGRQGLQTFQMLEAIRSAGHDPLIVEPKKTNPSTNDTQAVEFAAPYLESGLPVILGLTKPDAVGHAVVAIGYTAPSIGQILPDTLTIHNDNAGCYLDLKCQPPTVDSYALEHCSALITLLPDGICMTASEADTLARSAYQFGTALLQEIPPIKALTGKLGTAPALCLRVFLSTRHSFRNWAMNATDLDAPTQIAYRTFNLPKFLWVAEIHEIAKFERGKFGSRSRFGEVVLDASADALHGDALIFTRLSGLVLGDAAPADGLLIIEKCAQIREVVAIQAAASIGQAEPWK